MLSFDTLFILSFAGAIAAVIRLRASTFIILANMCSMLRAFSSIQTFGQPYTQKYLPAAVFDPSRLETAQNIFTIVTLIGLIAVAAPKPQRERDGTADLPALPRWLMGALAMYFTALAFSSDTIFTGSYADRGRGNFELPQGGLVTCLQSLVVYELYRRVCAGRLSTMRAFAFLLTFLFITDYSKGSTGGATGFLFMGTFLLFGRQGAQWARPLKIGAVLLMGATLAIFVRTARTSLYSQGVSALEAVPGLILQTEETRAEGAEGIETHANGSQNAAHVLECVYLYDAGYSREWRSFYDPIVYTFQPSFIMDLMDWKRAIEPAWELGKYFIHGGGIAIFGEMYWNGGYFCVAFGTMAAFLLAYLADTRRNRSFGWLFFYCTYTSGLVYGVGYGLTYLFRAMANALVVTVIYTIFARQRRIAVPEMNHGLQPAGIPEA